MCHHPRGLSKNLRHEFLNSLAPDRALLKDFKAAEKSVGHNEAFETCAYEDRFAISPELLSDLKRLSDQSKDRHVYLICQCEMKTRCHREMLLLTARELFDAEIGPIYFEYPKFLDRVREFKS